MSAGEVLQTRCPRCTAEQYVMGIFEFSEGMTRCWKCDRKSMALTYREWQMALGEGGWGAHLEARVAQLRDADAQP